MLLFVSFIGWLPTAHAALAAIGTAVAVKTGVDELRGAINGIIDKAYNTGDVLLFRSGQELLKVLDSWEQSNKNLLDHGFNKLDRSQELFFSNLSVLVDQVNNGVVRNIETARQITDQIDQMIADVKIFDKKMAVTRYRPRVLFDGIKDPIFFQVNGINFDKNDPQLFLSDGTQFQRVGLTRTEAIFVIPPESFTYERLKSGTEVLELSYLTPSVGFFGGIKDFFSSGWTDRQKTNLVIWKLPQVVGFVSLKHKFMTEHKEYTDKQKDYGLTGNNDSRSFVIKPISENIFIDPSSAKVVRSWGESGKGCIVKDQSKHGFIVLITTAKRDGWMGEANQHCKIGWKEYVIQKKTQEYVGPEDQELTWVKDLNLPSFFPEKISYELNVRAWDGKERLFTGRKMDDYYSIIDNGDFLTIRARVPVDMNNY